MEDPISVGDDLNLKHNLRPYNYGEYAAAWTAHIFTALGVVACALAMMALFKNEPSLCFLWLIVAYIIDGVDGSLARVVHVEERLTNYDGFIMDSIIDYISYVFVPAFLIYFYVSYPPGLKLFSIALILISSMYFFFKKDMKTHDYYFNGIPTIWQLISAYLFIASPDMPWVNFIITIIFCILQDVNFNFVHPFRVRRLRYMTITVSVLWTISTLMMVFSQPAPENQIVSILNTNVGEVWLNQFSWGQWLYQAITSIRPLIIVVWTLCPIYIMGISIYRTYEKLAGKVAP
ncbi:MAG: hypothetical protein DI620_01435 [Haemophilus parainfluenzae]|jgi:phosphatidylcholine synthase|nr:MAG: hypothetical protein DI620_01435 [Haemophilus parainfluenzae]